MKADARLDFSFPHHPKTVRLRHRLGHGGPLAFVYLILWVGQNRPDGNLTGLLPEDLEIAAGWQGPAGDFVQAALDIGFLDQDGDGTYSVHDWADHQPWLNGANERSERASHAAKTRWGHSGDDGASASQCETNDQSMQGACKPHADSMRNAASGYAPSPYPSPIPSPYPSPIPCPTPSPASARENLSVNEKKFKGSTQKPKAASVARRLSAVDHTKGISPDGRLMP